MTYIHNKQASEKVNELIIMEIQERQWKEWKNQERQTQAYIEICPCQ